MGASPSLWQGSRRTNAYKFNSAGERSSFDQLARPDLSHALPPITVDSLTDYETSLLPKLWKKATAENPNFCFNVYGRFLSLCPEMQLFFRPPAHIPSKRQYDAIDRGTFQPLAARLSSFFDSLIADLASDTDGTIERCRQLGALHASFIPSTKKVRTLEGEALNKSLTCVISFALPPIVSASSASRGQCDGRIPLYAWSAFAEALVREFDASLDCNDVDERELQLLAWRHFVEIISAAIADGYETSSRNTQKTR